MGATVDHRRIWPASAAFTMTARIAQEGVRESRSRGSRRPAARITARSAQEKGRSRVGANMISGRKIPGYRHRALPSFGPLRTRGPDSTSIQGGALSLPTCGGKWTYPETALIDERRPSSVLRKGRTKRWSTGFRAAGTMSARVEPVAHRIVVRSRHDQFRILLRQGACGVSRVGRRGGIDRMHDRKGHANRARAGSQFRS